MTRDQQKLLKEIDRSLLLAGLHFQNLIKDRGKIDQESTLEFIDTFCDDLKKLAKTKN